MSVKGEERACVSPERFTFFSNWNSPSPLPMQAPLTLTTLLPVPELNPLLATQHNTTQVGLRAPLNKTV